MYVGRIVVVGKTDKPFVAYRVSSRSFPDRMAHLKGETASIIFKPGSTSDNPFTTYNCIRLAGTTPIATNGTHTDLIVQKINEGTGPEKAIHGALDEMGYEKDELNTPRIAGAVEGEKGFLGIVTTDGTKAIQFNLKPNTYRAIATYGLDMETEHEITALNPGQLAHFVYDKGDFAKLEQPVCSAAYSEGVGIYNPMTAEGAEAILTANVDEKVAAHSKKVRDVAIGLAKQKASNKNIDLNLVETGALLHDIGRAKTHDISHVTEGIKFAQEHDFSTELVSIIHNHAGAGLDPTEAKGLGLPEEDFNPKTMEEKIVSYADLLVFGGEAVDFEEALKRYNKKYPDSPYLSKIKKLHDEIIKN